jgi:FolB domain-containing protein
MDRALSPRGAAAGETVDLVHIDNLVVRGCHGVGAEERSAPQDFEVSIVLGVDIRTAGRTDKLDDTVNYQTIKDVVHRIVEHESFALVESIADRLWDNIRADRRIQFAEIRIKKLNIWSNGIPGITVFRNVAAVGGRSA